MSSESAVCDVRKSRKLKLGNSAGGGYPNGYVVGGGVFLVTAGLTMTGNATVTDNTRSLSPRPAYGPGAGHHRRRRRPADS